MVARAYGGRLKTHVVGFSTSLIVKSMSENSLGTKCDAFILDQASAELRLDSGLCDWQMIGTPVLWLPVSQPVINETLGKGLSILQRSLGADKFYEQTVKTYLPDQICDLQGNDEDVDVEAAILDLQHFVGPFMVLGLTIMIALTVKVVRSLQTKAKASNNWKRIRSARVGPNTQTDGKQFPQSLPMLATSVDRVKRQQSFADTVAQLSESKQDPDPAV
eukprot:m.41996 g.41996  ORF g.41996 m.41996 type:complete len:219 (+) comp9832_c0_seq1:3153-3809(+)